MFVLVCPAGWNSRIWPNRLSECHLICICGGGYVQVTYSNWHLDYITYILVPCICQDIYYKLQVPLASNVKHVFVLMKYINKVWCLYWHSTVVASHRTTIYSYCKFSAVAPNNTIPSIHSHQINNTCHVSLNLSTASPEFTYFSCRPRAGSFLERKWILWYLWGRPWGFNYRVVWTRSSGSCIRSSSGWFRLYPCLSFARRQWRVWIRWSDLHVRFAGRQRGHLCKGLLQSF